VTSVDTTLYGVYSEEFAELLDVLLTGFVIRDETVNRRLIQALSALIDQQRGHRLDENGHCAICCRPRHWWSPRPHRAECTPVHVALAVPTTTPLTCR
jgi:hypothetical protein